MSFLKFWKKDKKGDEKKEEPVDPELEKRKLRHSLSISRSGRWKQKKRDRGQCQELFGGEGGASEAGNRPSPKMSRYPPIQQMDFSQHTHSSQHTQHTQQNTHNTTSSQSSVHPRSPNSRPMCRDVSNMDTGSLRIGQPAVR